MSTFAAGIVAGACVDVESVPKFNLNFMPKARLAASLTSSGPQIPLKESNKFSSRQGAIATCKRPQYSKNQVSCRVKQGYIRRRAGS